MGCIMNTYGVGSGKQAHEVTAIEHFFNKNLMEKLSYGYESMQRGYTILLLWGVYGKPNTKDNKWKKFVNDARVSILDLKLRKEK